MGSGTWHKLTVLPFAALTSLVLSAAPAQAATGPHPALAHAFFFSSGLFSLLAVLFVIAIPVGFAIFYFSGSTKTSRTIATNQAQQEKDRTEELGQALLKADNMVRETSADLDFAQAQFGIEATINARQQIREATDAVQQAFLLQAQVADAAPYQRDPLIGQALDLTNRALQLTEQVASELKTRRQEESQVSDELRTLAERIKAADTRIDRARADLRQLAAVFPAERYSSICENPDKATELLQLAASFIAEGQTAAADYDWGTAQHRLTLAQRSFAQADTAISAVEQASEIVANAPQALAKAIASISSDLNEIPLLKVDQSALSPLITEAHGAISQANTAATGSGDPIAALERLRIAEAAIDAALEGARSQAENTKRDRERAQQLSYRAQAEVQAADSFIQTNRGAVGVNARTMLGRAYASLEEGNAILATDPARAHDAYQAAIDSANNALNIAQQDSESYAPQFSGGPGSSMGQGGLNSLLVGGILGATVASMGSSLGSSAGSSIPDIDDIFDFPFGD